MSEPSKEPLTDEDIDFAKQNLDLRTRMSAAFRLLDDLEKEVRKLRLENYQLKFLQKKEAAKKNVSYKQQSTTEQSAIHQVTSN